ncbi:OprD family porin [bacterium]|nr:OprD family porin [bacterium]
MKKIILSVAVATMALSTVASALEDIKVSGQAKVWYETNDKVDNELFRNDSSYGETVFKIGVTGKQGDVGAGITLYQTSTMGLEGTVVSNVRSADEINTAPFVGEAYITAPLIASTILKFGKQELNTPLAFTETWNSVPNTFNAAVLVNNSVDNLTLIAAYIGQSTGSTMTGNFDEGLGGSQYFGGGYAVAGLYKSDAFAANLWAYQVNNVLSDGLTWYAGGGSGVSVNALWADASMKAGVVNLTGTAAYVTHDGDGATETSAFALSADTKVSDVTLFAAASTVSEGDLPVANTATGFKKSKLPTEAVYTDGLYVAQPGSTAFKLKASGKLGTTGLALQGVMNNNSGNDGEAMGVLGFQAQTLETTEVDLIISQKLGDFDLKGILMNRSFADNATDDALGGNYVRVIASVNF